MPRKLIASLFTSVDDVVLGRVTYQEWSGYFPTSDDPFADFINPVRKHVASRTLAAGDLVWDNARLVEGDLLATSGTSSRARAATSRCAARSAWWASSSRPGSSTNWPWWCTPSSPDGDATSVTRCR